MIGYDRYLFATISLLIVAIFLLQGGTNIEEQIRTGGFWTRRYCLTSAELTEVTAVRGTANLLEEKPFSSNRDKSSSLYQRRFKLKEMDVIYGRPTFLENVSELTFYGFTLLASTQRVQDSRSPTLRLEGQDFFDSTLSPDSMDVILLIGEPEIDAVVGFMGQSAAIESGAYKGQAVRAFLIEGANATLPSALLSLVGWQPQSPTLETAKTATMASHPLIALDALRIAVRTGMSDQIELLAQWLLHPSQPAAVKATAVELLGQAIIVLPQGSKEVDRLIDIAVSGWEAESAYPINATYLRALQSSVEHIKVSNQLERVRGIAGDYQIRELGMLSEQLTNSLDE